MTNSGRSLAGRSSPSSTPPRSYQNSSPFSSQETGSSSGYGNSREGTSSFDESEQSIGSVDNASDTQGYSSDYQNIYRSSPESMYTSSGESGQPVRTEGNSSSGSFTGSYERHRDSATSYSRDSTFSRDPSSYTNGSSAEPRQSRWDSFTAQRSLSAAEGPIDVARSNRAASVTVEHRGDSSLIHNDREFIALQRNKSAQFEWNKRFPEGTIVVLNIVAAFMPTDNTDGYLIDLCQRLTAVKLVRGKPPRPQTLKKERLRPIQVYTDGSCIDNRASGFGIYFGPNHELNRSERIIGPIHNSNLAEILGAQMALRTLRSWRGYKNEPVILRTDYLPLVRAMSTGMSEGRFAKEMDQVRHLAQSYPNGVRFEHVYAHDGDPGNEQADVLARIATADARRARSASAPYYRGQWNGWPQRRRSRSRSRSPPRNRSRSATWSSSQLSLSAFEGYDELAAVFVRDQDRNRSMSRNNDRNHVRSHSAFVPGRRR